MFECVAPRKITWMNRQRTSRGAGVAEAAARYLDEPRIMLL
jgi:hypothetical protein